MRKQTKMMLQLLENEAVITDSDATKSGITNPRREAGLLQWSYNYPVIITKISDNKREYKLMAD